MRNTLYFLDTFYFSFFSPGSKVRVQNLSSPFMNLRFKILRFAMTDPKLFWRPVCVFDLCGAATSVQKLFLFMHGSWLPSTHNKGSINVCLMNK